MRVLSVLVIITSLSGCVRPAEERALMDLEVGLAAIDGLDLQVAAGLAAVRSFASDRTTLWAQAPALEIELRSDIDRRFTIDVLNCMPDSELAVGERWLPPVARPAPTRCVFDIDLRAGDNSLVIAPADFRSEAPYRFAVMGDIQRAMHEVDDVFALISETPEVRFVLCTGDVVEDAEAWEYEMFLDQLETLDVPFFSTIGNHELTSQPERWHDLFGRYSIHFRFKGAALSFVDSGSASLDPLVYDWLDEWLEEARDRVHVFGTHYPPFDPVGVRNASFRSRPEAAKLLTRLAAGRVDLTLYGHIHSYYSFDNAGIPARISGGGGALPEKYDGFGRHFLAVDVDPASGIEAVTRIDVD